MVKLQEAENQIITNYEVYARRPHDSDLLVAAIETHQTLLGRAPRVIAADAAFYSAKMRLRPRRKVSSASAFCIPNRSTKSPEVPSASASRESAGSAMVRNGAPDVRCEGRIS